MRVSQLLSILLVLFASRVGFACQCRDVSLEQQLTESPYAFVAVKSSSTLNEWGRVSAVMLVAEVFKGELPIGRQIIVDYADRTSCEAFVPDGVALLILGYGDVESGFTTSKCSAFATGPILIEGKYYEPSEEISAFVRGLRKGNSSGR